MVLDLCGPLTCLWLLALACLVTAAWGQAPAVPGQAATPSETLANGISLPRPWPPQGPPLSYEPPAPPPYLASPPAVIPIDLGRQLFVDDFLIADTTMSRTYHAAQYAPDNPVLRPDREWETVEGPTAMAFSDGVWYDPADHLFKMWYMGGYVGTTCYATSHDGAHWEKPDLDVRPGTNIVHQSTRDSSSVWLDLLEADPARRYKLFIYPYPQGAGAIELYFSPDGIHWGPPAGRSGPCGDRTTVFYNPFRNRWVYSLRSWTDEVGRMRVYWDHADPVAGLAWQAGQPVPWVGADRLDPPREDIKTPCQLYNLDCVAYESILLGLFSLWRGQPQDRAKPNEVVVGYSRDGFHWTRPVREAFIPVSERYGDWNWGNVQSVGGCCLIDGDRLLFYVSGRSGVTGSRASGTACTGLATLRRDGFASMDAGPEQAVLTTRPVRFTGKYLFVNLDAPDGRLLVDVLDEAGHPIEAYTADKCETLQCDSTRAQVTWSAADDLSGLAGRPVRFRFHLWNGGLYAFWVSPSRRGESNGYVAAGGPGFTGPTDSVGADG